MNRDQQISVCFIIKSDSNSRRQMIHYLMGKLIELEIKGEILAEEAQRELLQELDNEIPPIGKALEVEMNQKMIEQLKSILNRFSRE